MGTRGKIQRRAARARAHGAQRGEVARTVRVHSEAELAATLERASWWNTSRAKRLVIEIAEGTYHQRLELLDGIDLAGAAEIVWDGVGDTVLTHGADTILTGLTVRHVGSRPAYAIHADAPCFRSTLTLADVTASSDSKAALGVGLFGGQRLDAARCTFTSTGTAVYVHSWNDQALPAIARFDDCTAQGDEVAIAWTQLASGQRDELHWTGRLLAPLPLEADQPPPVLQIA